MYGMGGNWIGPFEQRPRPAMKQYLLGMNTELASGMYTRGKKIFSKYILLCKWKMIESDSKVSFLH